MVSVFRQDSASLGDLALHSIIIYWPQLYFGYSIERFFVAFYSIVHMMYCGDGIIIHLSGVIE